jgi:hypothetical protein
MVPKRMSGVVPPAPRLVRPLAPAGPAVPANEASCLAQDDGAGPTGLP